MRISDWSSDVCSSDLHGVIRIPRYVQWAADGLQVPNQTITILLDQPSFAIIDGRYGFGQSIGEQAVDVGIAKAKQHGVAVTALRNSGHLGRIGDWAERAAAQGGVSIQDRKSTRLNSSH